MSSEATVTRLYDPGYLRDLRHMEARAARDLGDWLVRLDLEGKAPRTLYQYARQIAPLLRAHPELALDEITPAQIEDMLAAVPRRSRHITRSILNSWFAWAENEGRVAVSPMRRVAKIRAPKGRPSDIFSVAEQAQLEALPAPDGQLFALLFGSGLRRAEARQLRRRHIDLARGRLIVLAGKGGREGVVPLLPDALAAVADLDLLERLQPDDHLWYTRRAGRRLRRDPIGDSTFERWYRRCLDEAEVRYLNPHQTRHTYGHRLRELGFDLEERRLLMRHESIATTVRYYGHLTIEDVAAKIARL
jgi:integrase/recombinase XerC